MLKFDKSGGVHTAANPAFNIFHEDPDLLSLRERAIVIVVFTSLCSIAVFCSIPILLIFAIKPTYILYTTLSALVIVATWFSVIVASRVYFSRWPQCDRVKSDGCGRAGEVVAYVEALRSSQERGGIDGKVFPDPSGEESRFYGLWANMIFMVCGVIATYTVVIYLTVFGWSNNDIYIYMSFIAPLFLASVLGLILVFLSRMPIFSKILVSPEILVIFSLFAFRRYRLGVDDIEIYQVDPGLRRYWLVARNDNIGICVTQVNEKCRDAILSAFASHEHSKRVPN